MEKDIIPGDLPNVVELQTPAFAERKRSWKDRFTKLVTTWDHGSFHVGINFFEKVEEFMSQQCGALEDWKDTIFLVQGDVSFGDASNSDFREF